MNENLKNEIAAYRVRFMLYLIIVAIPWMFLFELLPFEYEDISVFAEVSFYILWSLVLIFSMLHISRENKYINYQEESEYSNKRMWKVAFRILFILMLFTASYLVMTLFIIMLSYMV